MGIRDFIVVQFILYSTHRSLRLRTALLGVSTRDSLVRRIFYDQLITTN